MDPIGVLKIAAIAGLVVAVVVFVGLWLGNRAVEAIEDTED